MISLTSRSHSRALQLSSSARALYRMYVRTPMPDRVRQALVAHLRTMRSSPRLVATCLKQWGPPNLCQGPQVALVAAFGHSCRHNNTTNSQDGQTLGDLKRISVALLYNRAVLVIAKAIHNKKTGCERSIVRAHTHTHTQMTMVGTV